MSGTVREEPEILLPKPPGVIRRWLAEHPKLVDYTILLGFFIGALPLAGVGIFSEIQESGLTRVVVALNACFTLLKIGVVATALVLRRTHPFWGVIAASLALIGDGSPVIIAYTVALWFLLYAVAVYQGVLHAWIAYGISVALSVVSAFVPVMYDQFYGGDGSPRAENMVLDAVWLLVVVLVGINLGNRRRYVAAIIDRANQLALERDQRAKLAVAEERARIAREMHDIVAHSVSVMIALAEGSARAVEVAPSEAASAMQRSAETGRTALTEMRRLLGALQSGEAADLAPQPSVSDIDELVRGFVEAGLIVSYSGGNVTLGDRSQELAIYRVVQEGLTNVLRYAGEGARANVTIVQRDACVEVTVRDYGSLPNANVPTTGLGSGRGLTGLAERVRVFGGEIHSGPVAGEAGWQLRAVLPAAPGSRDSDSNGSDSKETP